MRLLIRKSKFKVKQEGPRGPRSLTRLMGQKVTVEPLSTPEAQIENKG